MYHTLKRITFGFLTVAIDPPPQDTSTPHREIKFPISERWDQSNHALHTDRHSDALHPRR